jgi:hypothetical protein
MSPARLDPITRSAAVTLLAALLLSSAASANGPVPTPRITGPIDSAAPDGNPEHDYPYFSDAPWLARYGYVEEEFFLEGEAKRYERESGDVVDSGHAYKTRLVVRRPAEADDFNGIVALEWQNVTAGFDLDFMWSSQRRHLVDEGYAWVGISAQRVGVDALRAWSPKRYGSLDVTAGGEVKDDSLSYDIFAQAARALRERTGSDPMGGLEVELVFGEGASQSAGRLVPFYNLAQPHYEPVIDVLFLAIGGGATRTDSAIPVFRMLTETDVLFAIARGREPQADTDLHRTWEVAGTSHSGWIGFLERQAVWRRDLGQPLPVPPCDDPAYARVPAEKVYASIHTHMTSWAREGVAPPTAPRLTRQGDGVARDERGNALGGIRLAEHAVPTATNSGANTGERFCRLYGMHQPFDDATLAELYPSHADYVDQVRTVTWANVEAGYVLARDAAATEERATHSEVGAFDLP